METMSMEVVYMQASETCLHVTDQYSDPETVHNDIYFEITESNSVKEVQDQFVL